MIHYDDKNKVIILLVLLGCCFMVSCGSTKKVPYFQDLANTTNAVMSNTAKFTEPVILVDDLISISIFTIDPLTSMVINQVGSQAIGPNSAGQASALIATQATAGFLVDKKGEIDLSVIGKVKLLGLTTYEARDLIKEKASLVYQDPNVQVRFANFRVTILGEVTRPAAYTVPTEKVSVLDALGLAGDLTIYGRRENVLLIRDNDGKKEFARLDLNSTQLFNSPYYYLKQNDVLYIEPNKGKAATLNQARSQTIAILGTALTVLITLITRL